MLISANSYQKTGISYPVLQLQEIHRSRYPCSSCHKSPFYTL